MQKKKINSLIDWWQGIKHPPIVLEIHPAKRCNLKCLFCKVRYDIKYYKNELPYSEYAQLIKSAKHLGVSQVMILGKAEPFARKDILKIMRTIKHYGMYGYICTNSLLMDEKKIKEIIKLCWDRIEISLHGSSSEIHDKLVNKKGAFDILVKNIKMINRLKAKHKTEKPIISITTTLNKLNYKDVPHIITLASAIKADILSLNPLILNNYNQSLKMTNKEIKEFYACLEKMENTINKAKCYTNCYRLETHHFNGRCNTNNACGNILAIPCYSPWLKISIDEDGYASQCSFYQGKENIRKKSLDKIWYGAWFNAVRTKVKKGLLFRECKGCCAPNIIENELIAKGLKSQTKI